jgi:hypothetical protein
VATPAPTPFGRAAHELRHLMKGTAASHRHLRDRLTVLVLVTLVVDAVAAVAVYLLEHHAPGSDVRTIGSAAFWTTAQLLTVSSNFANPISTGARIIDVALEAYAIMFVASLAGVFGAFFMRRGLERDPLEAAAGMESDSPD